MKKRILYLVAAVTIILGTTAVKPAVAYFTDTKSTEGRFEVKIGDGKPEIEEDVSEMTKRVTVKNTGDYDIFVRIKAIYPSEMCTISYIPTEGWENRNDGYFYYNKPLAPGEATPEASPLTIKVERISGTEGDFNVIILQEATKVLYDENGNQIYQWQKSNETQSESE